MTVNGVINLNKRKGISSFKAVSEVRRAVNASKAGHAGTLDPEASGVLPVCLGKSTKISDYLMNSEKEYNVKMFLGMETDTLDLEGSVICIKNINNLEPSVIEKTILSFVGEIMQFPPMYSAIKVRGRKLYEYARKGESIEIEPRKIQIYYIRGIVQNPVKYENNELISVEFTVGCSKGTYIRSLCRDIGENLGCKGVMADLIRSISAGFKIENSLTIEDIIQAVEEDNIESIIIPPDKLLALDVVELDEEQTDSYMNGRKVLIPNLKSKEYLVKSYLGDTIGVGVVCSEGSLKGRKRL